jgi:3',5'-cyclic AMP phosphodiesterase CpdA
MRVVQISDTHLSRWDGPLRRNFRAVADFVNIVLKPDLVIHTGDLILSNPDADADYAAAKQLHLLLAAPVRFVPGNHDVGEAYDRDWWATTRERLARYRNHVGETPWLEWIGDVGLIGLNSQVFGTDLPEESDQWRRLEVIADAVRGRVVLLFQHMSFYTQYSGSDGRRGGIAAADRERVLSVLGQARVWGVANGHVHRYRKRPYGDAFEIWAPATGFLVEPRESARLPVGLEQLGVVLYEFDKADVRVTFQAPPFLENVVSGGFEESGWIRAEIAAARALFDAGETRHQSSQTFHL